MVLSKKFLPLFVAQFLGALNDNLFRFTLIAQLISGHLQVDNSGSIIQLSAVIFIIPFFLFSIFSGEIIDKRNKYQLLLIIKFSELVIMTIACIGIMQQNLIIVLICLFLTGVQSAFFGPLKFSFLPELLERKQLIKGNSIFTSSTFAAILIGVFVGSAAGSDSSYFVLLCILLIGNAILGFVAALFVPISKSIPQEVEKVLSPWKSFTTNLSQVYNHTFVFNLIICGSFFWGISTIILSEIPQAGQNYHLILLACLFLGAIIGGVLCLKTLHNNISTRYSIKNLLAGIVALLLMALTFKNNAPDFPYAFAFLLVILSTAMVFYVIPILTSIQTLCDDSSRARVIAVYNVWNACLIVLASLLAASIHLLLDNATSIILIFGAGILMVALTWSLFILPRETLQAILKKVLTRLYRVEIHGLENLNPNETPLIVCNHVSTLDGPLLSIFLEDQKYRMVFVVTSEFDNYPFAKSIGSRLAHIYKIDSFNPRALRTLIKDFRKKQDSPDSSLYRPMIFPEGRVTTTGTFSHVYDGAALLLDKVCKNKILPITIDGLQNSKFSYLQHKFPRLAFPKVTITIGKTQNITAPDTLTSAKQKRRWTSKKIERILEEQIIKGKKPQPNLTRYFIENMQMHGKNRILFADIYPYKKLTYIQTYLAAWVLGKKMALIQSQTDQPDNKNIGLLLPSSVGATVGFYGSAFYGLVPTLLNPTSGSTQLLSTCNTAQIKLIFTAKALMQRLPDADIITDTLKHCGIKIVYLEDLRETVTLKDKLSALTASKLSGYSGKQLPGYKTPSDNPGCILFTSGSEGLPKGVVLSHNNLIYNCTQILVRVSATHQDSMLNTLPVFHAFGLIAGVILPVASGMQTWNYPSPLHYRLIPEAIYSTNATVFFSTNTFLKNYGKYAHDAAFSSLKQVFAGAEKLENSTRELWMTNFGIRILEGYGTTETAPVIAVNSLIRHRKNTVGMTLPGIETHLEKIDGIDHGKCLWVRGKNNMLGYYFADNPGVIQPLKDNWYNTGDIVSIDAMGYISIVGRQKRFIKVAGEIVPLNRIESTIKLHWEQHNIAVVGIPDERRGEKVILITTGEITRKEIGELFSKQGLPNLWIPREITLVKKIPLLGSGKTDYVSIIKTAIEQANAKPNVDEDEDDASED